jgi:hypothetical protein
MEKIDEANETLEQLELLIGKENALKVFDFFQGENIYFPKHIGLPQLQLQIYADLHRGMSYSEAVKKYNYSNSYLHRIEKKVRNERIAARKAGKNPPPLPSEVGTEKPIQLKPRPETFEEQGELFNDIDK